VRVNDAPERVQGDENLPKIAVAGNGRAYTAWSVPNDKGDIMRANVRFALGDPAGGFTAAQTLNQVQDAARFPSIEVSPDGTVYLAWIDRRVDNPAPRRIYLTRLDATGAVLSSNADIGGPSCECCRVTLAFADGGKTVHVAYRQNVDNTRDMVVQTSRDGGVTFEEQVLISDDGWYSQVCPHSGPVIATDPTGALHAVWWTPGREPEEAGIYYSVSRDGGRSFAPRQLVDPARGPGVLHAYLGVGARGDVAIAWSNFAPGGEATQIYFRYLAADGTTPSPVQQLSRAEGNAFRPNLAVSSDKVYVAWTESKEEQSWLVLKSAPLPR
jgi:hypothetical protein